MNHVRRFFFGRHLQLKRDWVGGKNKLIYISLNLTRARSLHGSTTYSSDVSKMKTDLDTSYLGSRHCMNHIEMIQCMN